MSNLPGFHSITESSSLHGIVTILPDSEGKVGLYIPDLLQIDNQVMNDLRGTNGVLILENKNGNVLRRK